MFENGGKKMNSRLLWCCVGASVMALVVYTVLPRPQRVADGYLIAAFDRTGSTERESIRASQLREAYVLTDIAHDHKIRATFWAMDHDASIIFDDGVPPYSDDNVVIETIKKDLGLLMDNPDRDPARWRITQPGILLKKALEIQHRKETVKGPICVYISTDGAAENPDDIERFMTQALAWFDYHPNLHVIVSGMLNPKDEARWARAFAPLGDRYAVYPIERHEEALNRVRSVMYGELSRKAEAE